MLNEFKDKVSRRVSRITIVKITNAGALKSQDVIKTDKSKLYCQNDNCKNDIEVNMEMAKSYSEKWLHRLSRFPIYVITQV